MSKLGVIMAEEDDICELCGKLAETRPYGPNGEKVCYECGMKNPEAAQQQFRRHVLGEPGRDQ